MLTREGLAIGKMATFDDQALQVPRIVQTVRNSGSSSTIRCTREPDRQMLHDRAGEESQDACQPIAAGR